MTKLHERPCVCSMICAYLHASSSVVSEILRCAQNDTTDCFLSSICGQGGFEVFGFAVGAEVDVPAELAHVQVVVETALFQQLRMGAALDDLAVLQHQHLVGVANRA